ncbi:MAG: hypothetical protein J6S67_09350 [Methanobrevibacter sp.]|nr:hypothetical protein [Methanobrevibacter sp.]
MTEQEAILYFKGRIDSLVNLVGNYYDSDEYKAYMLAVKCIEKCSDKGELRGEDG